MSIGSRILAGLWDLPPAHTHDIFEHHDMRVAMSDGIELATDRYYPRGGETLPVILIRSPYGRGDQFRDLALILAERGFQVLLQSCRGTGGSGGSFHVSFQEERDGADTIRWLEGQPWYCGKLALLGTSYLGNAAWAAAHAAGSKVAAMALHATLSDARAESYAFDGFTLEGCLAWTLEITQPPAEGTVRLLLRGWLPENQGPPRSLPVLNVLPLKNVDWAAVGRYVPWWQDWVNHAEPGDPFWNSVNYSAGLTAIPPTVMIGGWYDIFLPWQIKDYQAMQASGQPVTITIGPWAHSAIEAWGESVRQALPLFRAQLFDEQGPALARAPVCLFVMGAEQWLEFDAWPPPGFSPTSLYLSAEGRLSTDKPSPCRPGVYVYDPADPTPAVHGPRLNGTHPTGDMAELESRPDVLLFTGEPLAGAVDVVGPVSAELFFRSSLEHTDFFLVLCDVAPDGQSTNICDGYVRIRPRPPGRRADGTDFVGIEFWPTAYRYQPGHRIRLIVASGAHPRYARNLGSGEPLSDAVTFHVARQEIFHDPEHPSRIVLPMALSNIGLK
jgi:putative CocE/NonD family hydrolase